MTVFMEKISENLNEIEPFNYLFAAIRGIQAGREYYIAMCPLRIIPKIFFFNEEEEIPPELRAQRVLNQARIPEITNYIIENNTEYVFSSLTASIDGRVQFKPYGESGLDNKMGMLIVPMTARFIINDGQHRRAAIEEALKIRPELGFETISVVFYIDAGLKKAQQMFADLNQHAVRPTRSLGILYNKRDSCSRLALDLANNVLIFKGLTDFEKSSISNRSIKMFTLSGIYQATIELLGKSKKDSEITESEKKLAEEYWTEVSKNIPEWNLLIQRKVSSNELRKDYIHAHGIALHALGIVGRSLMEKYPDDWKKQLNKLRNVDWSRSNTKVWEGRAMIGGRINKSRVNLILTTNTLKQMFGLELTSEEDEIENEFVKNG